MTGIAREAVSTDISVVAFVTAFINTALDTFVYDKLESSNTGRADFLAVRTS